MLIKDIRYAVRTLIANRGVTLVALACLSLGIGVNATLFSIVDGVLIKPFPFADPDRLLSVLAKNPPRGVNQGLLSYADYRDWRDSSTTIESLGGFSGRSLTLSDGRAEPERFLSAAITWNMFRVLGIPPVLGRDFEAADDRPGAEPVVIISDEVWRQRYASDQSIVGRGILINGRPHTVIGVMPPRFAFPINHKLWIPLGPAGEAAPRTDRSMQAFARMKPGVTIDQVRADLGGISKRLAADHPVDNEGWDALVRPLAAWMLPTEVSIILTAMMGAVTLVLLIACTNVANLLLARASVRSREIAVRSALGAAGWQIARQLLIESVLLGALSAPLGYGIAVLGLDLMTAAMPPEGVPYFIRWSLDLRSLVYIGAISLLTGVVFGLAPAIQAARPNLQETLKEGGRGSAGGRARLRNALVVVQVALALILLVGSSLFVRSFLNLQKSGVGFETAPLMTMRFFLPGAAYEEAEPKIRRIEDIVARVEALPGVEAAFASNFVPLGGGGGGGAVEVDGAQTERGKEPTVSVIATSAHMRKTLGVALLHGRDMTETEGITRNPVALINQSMAKQLWGDADPIGRRFRLVAGSNQEWFSVIGVVASFRHFAGAGDSSEVPPPSAYVPLPYGVFPNTGLTIRVAGSNPSQITSGVREQIRQSDPALPIFQIRTMEEQRQLSFWQRRLFGWMFGVFGVVALVLASIGVYGVLSYSVSQRTQEIGVRVALGASRGTIFGLVVGQGLKLAGIGIVIGLVGAFGVTRYVRTILFNVSATDPVSYAGVAAFLALVAVIASAVPARRATAVDPLVALRGE